MSMMTSAVSATLRFQFGEWDRAGNVDALAVWFDAGERLDLLHGLEAAHGQLLVEERVVLLPLDFLRRELAQHARRDAGDEGARRDARFRLDERERRDHRVLADF